MSFSDELKSQSESILNEQEKKIRAVTIKLFSAVIKDTPVGNPDLWEMKNPPEGYTGGNLRANWYLTSKTPSTRYSESLIDEKGDKTIERITMKMATDMKNSYILTNNSPYAERIEYEGHSSQAPDGMVRKNARRFKKFMSEIKNEK